MKCLNSDRVKINDHKIKIKSMTIKYFKSNTKLKLRSKKK